MSKKSSLAAVLSIAVVAGCGIFTSNVFASPGSPKSKVPDNVFEVGATLDRKCILFADKEENGDEWESKLYLLNDEGFIDLDYTYLTKYSSDVQAKLYDLDKDGDDELVISADCLGGAGTHIESLLVIESPLTDKVKLHEYTTALPDDHEKKPGLDITYFSDMLYKGVTFKPDAKDAYTLDIYNSRLGNYISTIHFSDMKKDGKEKLSILLGNVAKYKLDDNGIYLHTAIQNQNTFLPDEESEIVYQVSYDKKGNISVQVVGFGKLDSYYTPNPVSEKNMDAYKAFMKHLNASKIELYSGASISGKDKDNLAVSYMEIGKNNTPVLFVENPNSTHMEGYVHLFQYINGKVTHVYSTDEFDKVYVDSGIIAGRYNQVGTPFGPYDRTYHVMDNSGKLTLQATAFLIDDEDGYKRTNNEPYVGSYFLGNEDNKKETSKENFDNWLSINLKNDSLISRIKWMPINDFLAGRVTSENATKKAALVQNFMDIMEYSKSDIVMSNVDDFEGNGKYGAFVFVGKESPDYGKDVYEGKMWYTNGSDCQCLEDPELGVWLRVDGTLKFGDKKYVFADNSSGTATITMVWEVQDGKAVQSDISGLGYVEQIKNGNIKISSKAYDNYLDNENGFYLGATYKDYFFYYDEESGKMTEYAGTLLTKEQIDGIAGFDLVKQMESKDLIITTAYYYQNGFLTVNYLKPHEIGYRCGYITYDCNKKTYIYIHASEIQTTKEMPLDDEYEMNGIYQSRLGYGEAEYPYLPDGKTTTAEIVVDNISGFYVTSREAQITGRQKGGKNNITAVVIDDKTYFDDYDYSKFTQCKKGMTPLSWIDTMLYEEEPDYALGTYKFEVTNGHVDKVISFNTSYKGKKKGK